MHIGPVTLEGQQSRLEPVSLAHVPALWRAGAPEAIWRIDPCWSPHPWAPTWSTIAVPSPLHTNRHSPR